MLDLEVEIESISSKMSTSIQQYQVVGMGSPERSRRQEVISRSDLNAPTAQDVGTNVTSALVRIDEENFLVIENRATPKWWWLVHPALPNLAHLWRAWANSPPGREGSQGKWESPEWRLGASFFFPRCWATRGGCPPSRSPRNTARTGC